MPLITHFELNHDVLLAFGTIPEDRTDEDDSSDGVLLGRAVAVVNLTVEADNDTLLSMSNDEVWEQAYYELQLVNFVSLSDDEDAEKSEVELKTNTIALCPANPPSPQGGGV